MSLILFLQLLTLVVAVAGATGALYNAFWIQKPWREDDLRDRQKNLEDYPTQSTRSLPEDFIPENYRGYEPLDPYSKPKGYNYGGIMV